MSLDEFTKVLPWLRETDPVTVTLPVGVLAAAWQMANGGPEILSTAQAARLYGGTSRRWREWAKAQDVEGAWQEENGDWRLPRNSCRAHMDKLRRSAETSYPSTGFSVAPGRQVDSRRPTTTTDKPRSVRRGPRKKAQR